jgi:D-galactarolactone cycloisomerase
VARIVRAESFVYRVPIAAPIKTSFGTMPNRPAVFIRIEDADGGFGWGEIWSNFPAVGAEYRARLFDTVIAPRVFEFDTEADPRRFWQQTDRALHVLALQTGDPGSLAGALAGADIALHDLAARRKGMPLWRHLGGEDPSPIPVYASGINPGATAVDLVESSRHHGFRAFKVKIGLGEASDLATLAPVARTLKDNERLMVDVNQGWDLNAACRMAPILRQFPLFWIEEPLAADRPCWEWAQVNAAVHAPLAAGENLRGASAFQQALAEGYLSILQPDMCKWGGFSGTLPVARAAVAAGRSFCPHFLAGGIGLLASLHLLASIRGPGLAEFDVNPNPLREELIQGLLRLQNGAVILPPAPGLGFEPDLAPFRSFRTQHGDTRA